MQKPTEEAVKEDRIPWSASQLLQMALTKMTTCATMIFDQPLMLHIGVVLVLLWLASAYQFSSLWIFILAFLFLYEVDKSYILRTRRQLRSEERRSAAQRRPLSDFEQAEWLNQVIKIIWPHFLEEFVSKDLLKDLIPWFLDKYKPWTIRKTALRHLNLGRSSPTFTGIRILERTMDDDHLVMDMCLDFLAADDMDAVLAVQMRRRLGLGIWTNIHISKLQIEGKVRVGVKFSKEWPFLSRVRLCFENAPYVQMTAKPLSTHGMNVSELPLVAGWMERMVADVFEQSLVEPNMLVLDVARLLERVIIPKAPISSTIGKWFEIQERPPIAVVQVDVLEAMDLKPSDLNGLADPFVKGAFATCHFKTKIQKKTLNPKWHEEFEVPVASWELPTLLVLHVRDKDQFRDDDLGFCELDLAHYRGGQRHDMWIPLKDIKMGRLHVAVKVKETEVGSMRQGLNSTSFQSNASAEDDASVSGVGERSFPDSFETINLGKGEDGFVSIMRPGKLSSKYWRRQREGTSRRNRPPADPGTPGANDPTSSSSSSDEEEREAKHRKKRMWRWHSSEPLPSPKDDCKEILTVGDKGTTVRMKLEEPSNGNRIAQLRNGGKKDTDPLDSPSFDTASIPESPTANKSHMKNLAKGIKKQAGKTAQNLSHALTRKGSGKNEKEREHSEGGATLVDDTSLAGQLKQPEMTADTTQS